MTWRRFVFLLVVLGILSLGGAYFSNAIKKRYDQQRQSSIQALKTALQEYHQDQIPPQY
ncbi:hypothetical protein HYU72_01600, partial [Candidatus Berkelbacteria bacterium]|nr:hypothetical protein [Candidatus Berkelbacteria bacterium]